MTDQEQLIKLLQQAVDCREKDGSHKLCYHCVITIKYKLEQMSKDEN